MPTVTVFIVTIGIFIIVKKGDFLCFSQNEESHIYRIFKKIFSLYDRTFFISLTNTVFIGVCGLA
jgi:hypothetical protein